MYIYVNIAFFAGFTLLAHVVYIAWFCETVRLVLLWILGLCCER